MSNELNDELNDEWNDELSDKLNDELNNELNQTSTSKQLTQYPLQEHVNQAMDLSGTYQQFCVIRTCVLRIKNGNIHTHQVSEVS